MEDWVIKDLGIIEENAITPELALLFATHLLMRLKPSEHMNDRIEEEGVYKSQLTTSREITTVDTYVTDAYACRTIPSEMEDIKNIIDTALSLVEVRDDEEFRVVYLSPQADLSNLEDGVYYFDGPASQLPVMTTNGVFIEQESYQFDQDGFTGNYFKQTVYPSRGEGGTYFRRGMVLNNIPSVTGWIRLHDSVSVKVKEYDGDENPVKWKGNMMITYE